ncbi:uncharacterized protein LOC121726007 [Aricia agestis]|uniref:uncharacterized protein LOC121726007 n=1 Tax=Aricia agestis TaxID=91739 RepID=UPI001C208701|nr:uncharacterized protein LOC121726007 [Aricia agestis]
MKEIIALVALASVASGIQYNGLRVKFGWSDALADKEYFFKIPRTMSAAEAEGWRRTERPPGPLPDLRLYCTPDKLICPLYDPSGFVAGLQIAFPADEFESPTFKPETRFTKWSTSNGEGDPPRDYWAITQYYVSEESLKAGAGPQVENGATLQDGGVWVKDFDNQLTRIPSTEAELNSTLFKKQNCIPNMGTHYYYNMTKEKRCEDLLPWFALTTRGDLVGVGFQVFAKFTPKVKGREWFEILEKSQGQAEVAIPLGPECLYKLSATYPVISLHIYFIDNPWNIRCRNGDSIKPAPALDRLVLNTYRYANAVADEFKNLFSG